MATQTEPKSWARGCVDSIDLKASNIVRHLIAKQLEGVMQERPLKAGELSKLATALLAPPKTGEATEQAK